MKHEFIRKKLSNGLVILFEKRKMPVVSVSASVRQGFAYEDAKKKGISHVAEHIMFKGSKSRTRREIVEEIEKKGGVLNAYTDEEVTSYWNKVPSKHFSIGMDIATDLILNPRFDEVEFQKEKKVILEEIKMYKDAPRLFVFDKIKSLLYKKPFGISGIGTNKSVMGISRDDLISFFGAQYKTNKMFLSVVGNTSLEQIEKFGKKFPDNTGGVGMANPVKINLQAVVKRKGIDQANFVFAHHISSLKNKGRYADEIFEAVLSGGMSSRLFEEIREKRGLAYAVKGGLEQGTNFGYEMIYVGTTKDKIKKCKEIILKEIKDMKNLSQKDFEEAKEQLIGLRKVGSEESVNVMNSLVQEELAGDAREFYRYEDKINSVKLEEVRKLSKIKGYSSIALVPA